MLSKFEAVYVMVVTPWKRLSDEVLAQAIQRFYQDQNLLPPGVPLESIQGWAAKMAYGLRLCTQRFRKVYAESPIGAKSKEVAALKARLVKLGAVEEPPEGMQVSQACMEALMAPEAMARMQKYLKEKKAKPSAQAGKPVEGQSAESADGQLKAPVAQPKRPVPSAARSHRLPPTLLAALSQQPPRPFATDGTETEGGDAGDAEEEAAAPRAVKPGPKKAVKPKNKKGKNTPVATAEEERLLEAPKNEAAAPAAEAMVVPLPAPMAEAVAPLPAPVAEAVPPLPAPVAVADAVPPLPAPVAAVAPVEEPRVEGVVVHPDAEERSQQPVAYKAGDFKDLKKAWIKRKREETGVAFLEAQRMWMLCSERADLVASLPFAEQKKRRFA